jgi:hypothetical protein
MKCIRCNTDNKLKDRTLYQGRCSSCRHPFTFEPTAMGSVQITDMMFAKTLSDISVNGSLSFTRSQFFAFLEKRLRSKKASTIGCLIFCSIPVLLWGIAVAFNADILTAIPFFIVFVAFNGAAACLHSASLKSSRKNRRYLSLFLIAWGAFLVVVGSVIGLISSSGWAVIVSLGIGSFMLYTGFDRIKNPQIIIKPLISQESINGWLDNWQQINGSIPTLLQSPDRIQAIAPQVPEDVTHYSFDRLIVCDRDTVAHFLIANNFHFENNCAILSIDRYPTDIFESVMTMVRRNPDLKVFVIHDCSAKGLLTVSRIKTEAAWFANTSVTVIDIGLLPRQILESRRGFVVTKSSSQSQRSTQLPPTLRQSLSRAELAWLDAGHSVNLESIAPRQLMTALQRAIAKSQSALGEEFVTDSALMMADEGSDYFWVDSFG